MQLTSARGERSVPIGEFFLLPGNTPQRETVREPDELIISVTLPAPLAGARSTYLKLRDRASYEFALASAAAIVTVVDGTIEHARLAMGGVGTKPWRNPEAEAALSGKPPVPETFTHAAEIFVRDAKPQTQNGFKVELAKRCLIAALTYVTSRETAR